MNYLKEFTTHAEYEAYITSEEAILPNVSICNDNPDINHVHYNPLIIEPLYEHMVITLLSIMDGLRGEYDRSVTDDIKGYYAFEGKGMTPIILYVEKIQTLNLFNLKLKITLH